MAMLLPAAVAAPLGLGLSLVKRCGEGRHEAEAKRKGRKEAGERLWLLGVVPVRVWSGSLHV